MDHKIEITSVKRQHVDYLIDNLRQADDDEIFAMYGIDGRTGIEISLDCSLYSRAGLVDGTLAAIWGVCGNVLNKRGQCWMLATAAIEKVPRAALLDTGTELVKMLGLFEELYNYVDARNTVNLRYLRHLGFNIHPAEIMGYEQRLFHEITLRRENLCAL